MLIYEHNTVFRKVFDIHGEICYNASQERRERHGNKEARKKLHVGGSDISRDESAADGDSSKVERKRRHAIYASAGSGAVGLGESEGTGKSMSKKKERSGKRSWIDGLSFRTVLNLTMSIIAQK